jgi:LuxR family transcriptional regulator, maltose regulon positive regulatory protein
VGLLTGHRPAPPREPLLDSEVRVLRYLSTNLTVPEVASEHG